MIDMNKGLIVAGAAAALAVSVPIATMQNNSDENQVQMLTEIEEVNSDQLRKLSLEEMDPDTLSGKEVYLEITDDWESDTSGYNDDYGIPRYANIPLSKTDDTYFVNLIRADAEWWKYLRKANVKTKGVDNGYAAIANPGHEKPGHSLEVPFGVENPLVNCKYEDHDGVHMVGGAVGPAITQREYYEEQWDMQTDPSYLRNVWTKEQRPYIIAVVKDSDDTIWYVPIFHADVKGHTFPYGFMQTCITAVNTEDIPSIWSAGDIISDDEETTKRLGKAEGFTKKPDTAFYAGPTPDIENFRKACDYLWNVGYSITDEAGRKPGATPLTHYAHYIELWGNADKKTRSKDFNKEHTILGFIVPR